ncbi:ABC transporter ATP-binding protein [Clostridium oryzae]|uniref:Putative ABC transporter ATP-binding protein n=1 Tax=Clostridium oryzae TaxID=1450648 RepID=A0A1V4IRR7_9CLOT|nr:ABC transporter ATP-binding protein [Clostridium oryzae]OPJ62718.1 putative ABC transporter ATP-binding protein [Clostridium oryzae]
MKKLWTSTKWIFGIAKPFTKYLLIIILAGAGTSLINVLRAVLSKQLVDAATSQQLQIVFQLIVIIAATIITELIVKAIVTLVSSKCNIKISNNIQQQLFSKVMKTKWSEFTRYHSGDVLTRMTSDVDAITNIITSTIPTLVSLTVLLIGSFIAFLFLDPVLGILLIVLSPITVFLSKYFSIKLKKFYLKFQQIESKYRSFINESIQNMVVVKTFCLEQKNISTLNNIQNERTSLTVSKAKVSALANSILISGFWINYFLVFGWGALKLYNNTITFGSLTAMISLIGNIQGPFSGMAMLLPQVVAAIGSTERLQELEGLDIDYSDTRCRELKAAGIVYENVDFSYEKGKPILKNISANIEPGEIAALVGPSGEGKTTFINLLLALLYPDKGKIFIKDNDDRINVSSSTRQLISYVPQGNTLFSGTIRDNLLFGNPEAAEEEIDCAAKAASAYEFIKSNPEGFDKVLGERGVGISEGQAQRIAIARALLRKKPILILDEATSALDAGTEIEVLRAIKNLKPAPTCIIITHRTAALKICDKIFRIRDNNILTQQRRDEEMGNVSYI